ncbi:MAG: hypothetical protein C0503_00220 [Gemmatimonas sp.]|nr:hypothetical protein [Gemmatimonas sp.]
MWNLVGLAVAAGCTEVGDSGRLVAPNAAFSQRGAAAETGVEDVTPPTLVSVASSPAAVDVTAGPASISVTATLSDDVAGVQQWLVTFFSPSGSQLIQVFGTPGLASGTTLSGTFAGTSQVPQFAEAGVWEARSLSMTDNAGNNTSVDLTAAGFPLTLTVSPVYSQVEIDIKPGASANSVNPSSRGVIPVAILSSPVFSAAGVELTSVRFGAEGTEAVPLRSSLEDVDGDGDLDMVLHFLTERTGLVCGATTAFLKARTVGGQPVEGTDSITTVGCRR